MEPSVSGDGKFVTYVSKPSGAKNEVWIYDRDAATTTNVTHTMGELKCWDSAYRPTILTTLQAYWGSDPGYDMAAQSATSATSSICPFLARAGLIPAANTIEPLVPSISKDGSKVVFVSSFDLSNIERVSDDATGPGPVTTHTVFLV